LDAAFLSGFGFECFDPSPLSRQAHGSEPDFTNYAENKFGPFIGTLDYIFLSPKLRATGAVLLPSRDAVEDGPYPSLEEPSDHVLVWADVAIKA
jgi:2',5'-phosphodiesterase